MVKADGSRYGRTFWPGDPNEKSKKATQCFGHLVFFEGIERSPFRKRLAKVALNLSGEAAAYAVDFADAVHGLPWRECQSALTFASLAASIPVSWSSSQRSLLVAWGA